jgi:radical SAM-linked protein
MTQPPPLHRIRLTYQRGDALRYISHLEMQTVWERTCRRARLPLAYTQGFNPHPRLQMASALPLGFLSRCEVVDIWLEDLYEAGEVQQRAQASAPPGLRIHSAEIVALQSPPLQTQVQAAEYVVHLLDPIEPDSLQTALHSLLQAASLPRERRGKPYDLRPLVQALEMRQGPEAGSAQLYMRLTAREGATGRPEEVLEVLGINSTAARIERTGLILS